MTPISVRAMGPPDNYQLDVTSAGAFQGTLTGLSKYAGRTVLDAPAGTSTEVSTGTNQWAVQPLRMRFNAGGIVDAASYTTALAPGVIASIYGAGLVGAKVKFNGETASILFATPFQINARIPLDTPTGTGSITVSSVSGTRNNP